MANPIVIAALAGGALWLLLKKPEQKHATGGLPEPTDYTPPKAGTTTVQIPAAVLTPVDNTVAPENVPSVKLTVPTGAGVTPQQVATAVIPQLASQIAQAAQSAASSQTPVVPIGVAKFPDLPTGPVTPQQVATAVIPQVATQVAKAAGDILGPGGTNPLHEEEVKVDQDPNGTVALAKAMLNAESSPGWKSALKDAITAWQAKVGLKADGKFGEGSAYKMAQEVGVLPLIRYFALGGSGSKASSLKNYRDKLMTMAANADNHNPALAAALRSSATYEQGQSWATNPAAIPAASRLSQAAGLTAVLKGA